MLSVVTGSRRTSMEMGQATSSCSFLVNHWLATIRQGCFKCVEFRSLPWTLTLGREEKTEEMETTSGNFQLPEEATIPLMGNSWKGEGAGDFFLKGHSLFLYTPLDCDRPFTPPQHLQWSVLFWFFPLYVISALMPPGLLLVWSVSSASLCFSNLWIAFPCGLCPDQENINEHHLVIFMS